MKKQDLRIIKTRQKIKDAFLKLSAETNFDDITITDICLKAKITRKTFYNNFNDKFKLTLSLLKELTEEPINFLYKEINKSKSIYDLKHVFNEVTDNISELCYKNKLGLKKIDKYNNNSYYILIETFCKQEMSSFLTNISKYYRIKNWNNINYFTTFFVNGFLSFLLDWSKSQDSKKEEICNFLKEIFNNLLSLKFVFDGSD